MRIHGLAAIGLLAVVVTLAGNAQAATFTVTKTADTNDGVCNADCSLREAIAAANTNPGADAVVVPAGSYTLGIQGQLVVTDDLLVTGAAPVGSTVIAPSGFQRRVFQIDPSGGVIVDFVNLHVQNGTANAEGPDGGCIHNPAGNTLTLTDSLVTDCTAVGDGGGIWNDGTLTIIDSAVTGSSASGNGGGIYNEESLTITGTSIEGNQATNGGGIYGGTVSLDNTSVLLNAAAGDGGGIWGSELSIHHSSIAQNTVAAGSEGSGIYNPVLGSIPALTISDSAVRDHASGSAAAVYLEGSIASDLPFPFPAPSITGTTISGNSGPGIRIVLHSPGPLLFTRRNTIDLVASTLSGNSVGLRIEGSSSEGSPSQVIGISHSTITDNDTNGIFVDVSEDVAVAVTHTIVAGNDLNCSGSLPVSSLGHNLDDDSSCGFTAPGDLSNVPDAGLGPLGDYGGPTQTHALLPGSPAIDAGHAFDQRGAPLHDGDGDMLVVPDLGAYELPEPGLAVMLAAGVLLLPGLVWLRRRRRIRAR